MEEHKPQHEQVLRREGSQLGKQDPGTIVLYSSSAYRVGSDGALRRLSAVEEWAAREEVAARKGDQR